MSMDPSEAGNWQVQAEVPGYPGGQRLDEACLVISGEVCSNILTMLGFYNTSLLGRKDFTLKVNTSLLPPHRGKLLARMLPTGPPNT